MGPVNQLKRDESLTEFIWNNYIFTHKAKQSSFKIRLNVVFYLFDVDGNLHDINHFSSWKRKIIILCKYIMIRTCFRNYIIAHMQNT